MTALSETLAEIRRIHTGRDYINGVKFAIAKQLEAIDPTMELEDTLYFNHSAIPDFVAKWPGERSERSIYIRGSYSSIIVAEDVNTLRVGDPILLSISSDQDFYEEGERIGREEIREAVQRATHTLVTDADAIGDVAESGDRPQSPLTSLVRANFARGGRGLIDHERAETLVTASESGDGIVAVIQDSFFEDAALRMRRTAELIQLSQAGRFAPDAVDMASRGRLSRAEVQQLIPWLLQNPNTTRDRRFWRYVGGMMTFQDLEGLAGLVGDADLSILVRSNTDRWLSARGYLGYSDILESDTENQSRQFKWNFRGSIVGADIGTHRLHIATDGRALKGRSGSRLPLWDDLNTSLSRFRLQEVRLRGIDRSISVSAEESDNIGEDVNVVTQSVDDRYYVSELRIKFSREDADPAIGVVQFDRGLVSSSGTELTLREIIALCTQVLGYSAPEVQDAFDELVAP